jgi:hypothetical protein
VELVRRNRASVLEAGYRFGAPMVNRGRGAMVLVTPEPSGQAVRAGGIRSHEGIRSHFSPRACGRRGEHVGLTSWGSCSGADRTGGSPFGSLRRRDAVLAMSHGASAATGADKE